MAFLIDFSLQPLPVLDAGWQAYLAAGGNDVRAYSQMAIHLSATESAAGGPWLDRFAPDPPDTGQNASVAAFENRKGEIEIALRKLPAMVDSNILPLAADTIWIPVGNRHLVVSGIVSSLGSPIRQSIPEGGFTLTYRPMVRASFRLLSP
jgi:hypothetical protein